MLAYLLTYLGRVLEEVALGRPEAEDLGRVLPPLEVGEEEGRVQLLLGDWMEELDACDIRGGMRGLSW